MKHHVVPRQSRYVFINLSEGQDQEISGEPTFSAFYPTLGKSPYICHTFVGYWVKFKSQKQE